MPRASEEADAVGRSLVGAWSLLECAEIMQDGSRRLPLGEGARGAGTVPHFIEGAWFPNLENKAQVRTFRLEGDRLVLEAATLWGVIRNTWIRAGGAA
jgi:hypothetical protein